MVTPGTWRRLCMNPTRLASILVGIVFTIASLAFVVSYNDAANITMDRIIVLEEFPQLQQTPNILYDYRLEYKFILALIVLSVVFAMTHVILVAGACMNSQRMVAAWLVLQPLLLFLTAFSQQACVILYNRRGLSKLASSMQIGVFLHFLWRFYKHLQEEQKIPQDHLTKVLI